MATSHLIHTRSRTGHGAVAPEKYQTLYSSSSIPFSWFFLFGGRNIWNPGDDVEARGGIAGERNPYETSVEVALTRIEHAISAFKDSEQFWPFFSPMLILERKLMTLPKNNFIRLLARDYDEGDSDTRERWRVATAYAENAANYLVASKAREAVLSLRNLHAFSEYVPGIDGHDISRLEEFSKKDGRDSFIVLSLNVVGYPENMETFEKAAAKFVSPALADYEQLPAEQKQINIETSSTGAVDSEGAGIVGKLKSLFRRS